MNTNQPPYYNYPQYTQPYQPAVRNITMPFVNGEAGALAYPGPLNATSYYMDSTSMTIYEKTLDGLGQVTAFGTYDLVKREVSKEEPEEKAEDPFIKKSELEEVVAAAVSNALAKAQPKHRPNPPRQGRPKEDKE